jgi:flagellar hook-associated protein 3 FlgL
MRVSTSTLYQAGTSALLKQQAEMVKTQQQMAAGRRILTAADDPVGASTALRISQSLAGNQQLQANQQSATNSLAVAESTMGAVGDLLQSVRERLLQAQNGTLSATERTIIADDVDGMLGRLNGLANAKDGSGAYLFAGYSETAQPFVSGTGGVSYMGDDGTRKLEVASGRTLGVSASGNDIFMRIKNGNGVFATAANVTNAGSGVIDPGSVANPAALNGHAYTITFNVAAGVTTYDIYDTTAAAPVSTGNAFKSGQAIGIAGMQFAVSGAPANGDVFTAGPATNQSMFKTLSDASAALRSSMATGARVSAVSGALSSLDRALDHAVTMRAEFGTRMNEISAHETVSGAVVLEHQRRLSELQDVDYTEAATTLMRQQTSTQAAQQSFAKIAKLSLFDYLG